MTYQFEGTMTGIESYDGRYCATVGQFGTDVLRLDLDDPEMVSLKELFGQPVHVIVTVEEA